MVDSSRRLVSVTLARTDNDQGVLTVFGAVGVLAEEATDFDLTAHFNADVVANVASGICNLPDYDWEYDPIEPQKHLATQTQITCENAGFGLPDDNLHAPNEKFSLAQFYGGILTSIHFLNALKDIGGVG